MVIPHDHEPVCSRAWEGVAPDTVHDDSHTSQPAPPGSALARIVRIAEVYPEARDSIDRWLKAHMPVEETLTLIILELSERLSESEKSLQSMLRDLRSDQP